MSPTYRFEPECVCDVCNRDLTRADEFRKVYDMTQPSLEKKIEYGMTYCWSCWENAKARSMESE